MDFLQYLAQEIEGTGHVVTREASSIVVQPINLSVESEIGERNEVDSGGQHSIVITINIKATHKDAFPMGIWDCTVGIGANDGDALSYAAQIWTSGVFPPLHEILVPTETISLGVPRLDLVSRNEDTGQEFPWQLYLGELLLTGDIFEGDEALDTELLAKKMLNAIVAELYEPKLIWIKAFISKLPDGSIHGDCWLNNHDWREGLNALYWFAEEWNEVKSYASLKQFMVVKPCAWDDLKDAGRLKQSLPPRRKTKPFKRWFGK